MTLPNFEITPVMRRQWLEPDDLWFKLAVTAAALLAIGLIWGPTYPPFVDAANVAYSGEVIHDLWQGGAHYSRWHALRHGSVSHMVFYGAYHVMRTVMPPLETIKALTTLSVLGLVAACYALARALRLSVWLTLPAFALAFNTNLSMGYLPFALGIPVIPAVLALIEVQRQQPKRWRLGLIIAIVALSPMVHFFLTTVLVPTVAVWSFVSYSGKARIFVLSLLGIGAAALMLVLLPKQHAPPLHEIFQWVPFSERWDQFDRDVLNWTTDGNLALSFPWLLVAFIATMFLTRSTPRAEPPAQAAKLPLTLLTLFLMYILGPMYISWPEPAWGFGVRVGIAFALLLPFAAPTAAVGWRRAAQYSPWVLFTFWHLCSLIGPFHEYAVATRELAALIRLIPKHSRILPLVGAEYLKDPKRYSFGGFTGFALRHVAKWAAVETQSYQPFSFCGMAYHPITCRAQLNGPRETPWNSHIGLETMKQFDFVLVDANSPYVKEQLRALPLHQVRQVGDWSLWATKEQ